MNVPAEVLRERAAQWLLAGALVLAPSAIVCAQPSVPVAGEPGQPAAFDLPSEPLAVALEHLMAATNLTIIVDSGLTDGLQSASVKGTFSSEELLRRMLIGTGLDARALGGGLFTLVRPPEARRRPLPQFIDFAAVVQAAVTNALCQGSDTRPMYYRTVIRLWFEPSGVVSRAELGHSTGDHKLDMAVKRTLHRLDVGAPLPSGIPLPMKLAIVPAVAESATCPAEPSNLQMRDGSASSAQGAQR
ncbi:STN domain-containing protein [Microbacteriaceae bacterium K1510]|nr:STN domain-containing protein [Microbacteriaceae bacterium K1510]